MKTKIIILLISIFCISCSTTIPRVPNNDNIGHNIYGSYIEISIRNSGNINGELISVDSSELVVLIISEKMLKSNIVFVPIKSIEYYRLYFAQHSHYGLLVPLYSLASFTHGLAAIVSLPVNLITTTAVALTADKAYSYHSSDISYDYLKMFARFPQGIPKNIDVNLIK